jgi:hypothetical protein
MSNGERDGAAHVPDRSPADLSGPLGGLPYLPANNRKPRQRFSSSIFFLLPVVALWVVPVAVFIAAVPLAQSQEQQALRAPDVHVVHVGSLLDDSKQAVDLRISLTTPIAIKADTSGTVTSSVPKRGTRIRQGTKLVAVDGEPTFAFVAAAPLYRDISPGLSGADVRSAEQFLADQKFLPRASVTSAYTPAARIAIDAFETRLGLPADGTLHESLFAWVPAHVTVVGTAQVRIGDSVSPGSVLFESDVNPLGASFADTASDANQPPDAPSGTLRLIAGQQHVDFKSLALDSADLAAVYTFLRDENGKGVVTSKSGIADVTYSGAVLAAAAPVRVGTVPSTAVLASTSGRTCIVESIKGRYITVALSRLRLVDGEIGADAVPAGLIGKTVVRDPTQLAADVQTSCK